MTTTLKRWATEVLAGTAVAALGLAVLAGSATFALGNIEPPAALVCATDPDTNLCAVAEAACTAQNGNAGKCEASRNCPCKPTAP